MAADEDQIRSGSDSPDPYSSPPPGKVTVTVASTGPPSSSRQKNPDALALALLPIHTSGGGRPSGGGGREDCWSEKATGVLIDAWGEMYLELSRGNLKQKHWEEVAEKVGSKEDYGKTPKTDIQCKNRIDTVKKKYKQEMLKIANGGGRSSWVFFDKLDRLIGSTAKIPTLPSGGGSIGGGGLHQIPMGIPMSKSLNLYHQQQAKAATPRFGAMARVTAASFSGGGGAVNVPMGIPIGQQGMMVRRCSESKPWPLRKRNVSDSDSECEAAMSEDSGDSLPPPPLSKRKRKEGGDWGGNKWRELSLAIMRFGEAYEQIENAKLQQMVEMEKERLKFSKELELQRMHFFVKTQLELSQLKQRGSRMGNSSNDHQSCKNKNNMDAIVNNSNNDVGN